MRTLFPLLLTFSLACGEKSEDTGTETTETTDTAEVSEPAAEDTEATPEELGQALYELKCMGCHGSDASGGSAPGIQNESDAKFYTAIQNGDGPMPAFPDLSDTDIANIIAYVRSL